MSQWTPTFAKSNGHPCWKVQKVLDEAGIDYVVVKQPFRKSKRTDLAQRSGQRLLPAIEFDDGASCARSPATWRPASATAG